MKSTLNRKKIIGIALSILIAVPVLTHNPIYYRLYPGSRIKANVQISVDGEAFPVDQSNFIFRDNNWFAFNPFMFGGVQIATFIIIFFIFRIHF